MNLDPGIYAHCIECDTYTPMEDVGDDAACGRCQEEEERDAYLTEVERVFPCPAPDPNQCADENHHWGSGMHHEDVEQ